MNESEFIFEWDPAKAESNFTKHGVTFEEASTVFTDRFGLLMSDPDHTTDQEERWILMGISELHHVLVVIHIEIEEQIIRVISARRANRREMAMYFRRIG